MNWQDFLDIATELNTIAKDHEKSEALYRTSISRSYYALYNSILKWSEDNGVRPRGKEHKAFFNALKNKTTDKKLLHAISIGQDLREKRNFADYKPNIPNNYGELSILSNIIERQAKSGIKQLNLP